jgi:hypothetical protein
MQFLNRLFQADQSSDLGRYEALTLDESAQNHPDAQLIEYVSK